MDDNLKQGLNAIISINTEIQNLKTQQKDEINRVIENYHPLNVGDVIKSNSPHLRLRVEQLGLDYENYKWTSLCLIVNIDNTSADAGRIQWHRKIE